MSWLKIRAVGFGLDNVIYDEGQYFDSAFREVARVISVQCGFQYD